MRVKDENVQAPSGSHASRPSYKLAYFSNMAVQRKVIDKSLLFNVIRHTDAHNKIQEENEMWKQYEKINVRTKEKEVSNSIRKRKEKRDFGHMRCDDEEQAPQSTYWMQQLYNFEANCSERWGHSGYKELYPEEFENTDRDEDKRVTKKRKKKEKRSHSKTRKKKKEKGKKKKMWKKKKESSDSEIYRSDHESGKSGSNKKRKRMVGSSNEGHDGPRRPWNFSKRKTNYLVEENEKGKNGVKHFIKLVETGEYDRRRQRKEGRELKSEETIPVGNENAWIQRKRSRGMTSEEKYTQKKTKRKRIRRYDTVDEEEEKEENWVRNYNET